MKPTLILDKSAFQALGRSEHIVLARRYRQNLTPVLLRELLADLARSIPSPETQVRTLAGKFLGSGEPINADYRTLCIGQLTGCGRFEVDGRPVIDDYFVGREPDGTPAILVDLAPANLAVVRWAHGLFSKGERDTAAAIRKHHTSFSVETLSARLRQNHVLIPRPGRLEELAQIASTMLGRYSLQHALLDWLIEQLRLPPRLAGATWDHWDDRGRPFLKDFAPYAFHCCRALLLLLIGMRHRVLSSRPTNRVDLEYLFYVPFCDVFVSGDKLHKQLAPAVVTDRQRLLATEEFRRELANSAPPEAGETTGRS